MEQYGDKLGELGELGSPIKGFASRVNFKTKSSMNGAKPQNTA